MSAMNALDGTEILGRLMHVLPALQEDQVEQQKAWMYNFKQKKDLENKANASSWHNWNTLFVSSSAVVEIMAKRFNKTKEEVSAYTISS